MIGNLGTELQHVQSQCIGLFKPHYNDRAELIIEENEHTIVTATIGDLFGLSTCTIAKDNPIGIIYNFPDGKTLSEMMDNPTEFNEWFITTIV